MVLLNLLSSSISKKRGKNHLHPLFILSKRIYLGSMQSPFPKVSIRSQSLTMAFSPHCCLFVLLLFLLFCTKDVILVKRSSIAVQPKELSGIAFSHSASRPIFLLFLDEQHEFRFSRTLESCPMISFSLPINRCFPKKMIHLLLLFARKSRSPQPLSVL